MWREESKLDGGMRVGQPRGWLGEPALPTDFRVILTCFIRENHASCFSMPRSLKKGRWLIPPVGSLVRRSLLEVRLSP